MTDVAQDALSVYQTAKAEFVKATKAEQGLVPQVKDAIPQVAEDAAQDVKDAVPNVQELMQTVSNLYAQINELKKQGQAGLSQIAQSVASDFAQGGDPVPHNLHLDDGTVIQNFPGLASHYTETTPATATSDAVTTTRRVVAAYPVNPTVAKV